MKEKQGKGRGFKQLFNAGLASLFVAFQLPMALFTGSAHATSGTEQPQDSYQQSESYGDTNENGYSDDHYYYDNNDTHHQQNNHNKHHKHPQKRGSITIIKDARPNHRQDFYFNADGQGVHDFKLDDDPTSSLSNRKTFRNLRAGEYNFTEVKTRGWELKWISCSKGANAEWSKRTVTIELKKGKDVTCTFVNKKKDEHHHQRKGSITIVKEAKPESAQDFWFQTSGDGVWDFALDDDHDSTLSNQKRFADLKSGRYSFTERSYEGWKQKDIYCSNGADFYTTGTTLRLNLKEGQNVTCTFENKRNVHHHEHEDEDNNCETYPWSHNTDLNECCDDSHEGYTHTRSYPFESTAYGR